METLCECLGIAIIPSEGSSLSFCQSHYACVHHLCNQEKTLTCKICGTKRRHEHRPFGTQRSRFHACLEPKMVESFLKETLNIECFLSAGELVCHSCYMYCKHILETENCMLSSDEIVKELQEKQKHLEHSISELASESCTPMLN